MEKMILGFVLSGLIACGGPLNGEPGQHFNTVDDKNLSAAMPEREGRRDEGHDCPEHVRFDGVSRKFEAQLNVARRAVCKYRRIEAALADGYVNTGLACAPGQGYHYIKNSLVGTTDIRHPPVLMYTKDGDLNSPEWVAPVADFPRPPMVFGQTEHLEDELGLWILHVWVWKLNPNGVFNDVNPNVTCP
ncbi:MAG TPA: hypothetical protein VEP66_06795 [Myxococcales bacterium]|nr:hypothetical protein [Myxococcales bacterium]